MAEGRRLRLLAELTRARRQREVAARFVPTEEEREAIAEGTLLVFELVGIEPLFIDLRRAAELTR